MEQNKVQATTGITFRILVALSICHCLNDTLQSVISAVYPLFKEDLGLSFAQIGLITLVYQSAASVCQPLTGLFFDKWPSAWSLPTGMSFTLIMPHVENLYLTTVLSFCVGLTLSSAFPAILVYAQELLPYKLGLISGLFFGFAFGVAGIASAVLGNMADRYGIEAVYNVCGYMPLIGLVTWFLPDLKKKR